MITLSLGLILVCGEGSEQTLNLDVRMRVGMKAFIISFRRDCEYMRIEVSRHLLCVQVLIF